jgi:hypothetical protein
MRAGICEWRGAEPWTCQAVRSGGFALSDDAIVILEEGDGGKAIWVAEVQP